LHSINDQKPKQTNKQTHTQTNTHTHTVGLHDMVSILLTHGADPNIIDKNEESCLVFATKSKQHALVSLLLRHGAVKQTNKQT